MDLQSLADFQVIYWKGHWQCLTRIDQLILMFGSSLANYQISESDPAWIGVPWAKSEDAVYFGPVKIRGADYQSFKVVNESKAKDRNGQFTYAISEEAWNRNSVLAYSEALRRNPKDASRLEKLAWIYATCSESEIRDGEKAISLATKACELSGWAEVSPVKTLAAAYAEAGDFENAVRWQERAIELSIEAWERSPFFKDRDFPKEKWDQRLGLYKKQQPYHESELSRQSDDPIVHAYDLPPSPEDLDDAKSWFDLGKREYDQKHFADCIFFFSEAIRIDPEQPRAFYYRGSALREIKQADRAIADYSEAIRLDPSYARAFVGRALAWNLHSDREQATRDCNEAIHLEPDNAWAFSSRGYIWQSEREYHRAIQDYSEAIRLDPKNAWLYRSRGYGRQATREYGTAIEDYTEAIRLNPDDEWTHNQLGWLLAVCPNAEYRDGKSAIKHATRACELSDWKDVFRIDTLAAAYAEAGNFQLAISWQKKAIEMAAESARDEYRSRLALYESGKPYRDQPK